MAGRFRTASHALAITALVLLAVGSAVVARPHRGPSLDVEPGVLSFGESDPRRAFTVAFTLRNRTSRPVTILGGSRSCVLQGCVEPASPLPLVIPARSSRDFAVAVKTSNRPGDYRNRLVLYTDQVDQSRIDLAVRGRVAGEASVASAAGPTGDVR